jgi:hypothetical protein
MATFPSFDKSQILNGNRQTLVRRRGPRRLEWQKDVQGKLAVLRW